MKFEDLTGQVFGKLTVLQRAPNKGKRTCWKCQCECGNTTETLAEYLKSGHTQSCGCIKENFFQKRESILNQKFNRLLVIQHENDDYWTCKCECGNIIYHIDGTNLLGGNTQSCGCFQKEQASKTNIKDLTGQKFGKLTVIKRVQNGRFNEVKYLCKCECGGQTITSANRLLMGRTQSCGCIKSIGEHTIQLLLQQTDINYIPQYSLDNLKYSHSNRRPFFDFGIVDNDNKLLYLIEYDGQFHFGYSGYGWNTEEHFNQIHKRDLEKNQYCFDNNIPLIRIPYTHLSNLTIDDLILEIPQFLLKKETEKQYYIIER